MASRVRLASSTFSLIVKVSVLVLTTLSVSIDFTSAESNPSRAASVSNAWTQSDRPRKILLHQLPCLPYSTCTHIHRCERVNNRSM